MEIQCSINQQERIAQLLMEIFGEKLLLFTDRNISSNQPRTLPSPNDLRGKIIIKVLKTKKQSLIKNFCFQSKKLPLSSTNEINQEYGEVTDDEDCYEDNKRRSKKVKNKYCKSEENILFLFK
jgi:uncharacterized protein with ATP-grasp and redox domains